MQLTEDKIKDILVANSYLSEKDAKETELFCRKNNSSFINELFNRRLLSKDILGQAIAEHLKVSYSDLNSYTVTKEDVLLVPEAVGQKFRVVCFKKTPKGMVFATDDPQQVELFKSLQLLFPNKKITFSSPVSA